MPTTPHEQERFILTLADAIRDKLIEDIRAGKLPAEWNGKELRQLLADRSSECVHRMSSKQREAYNNTVIVNDL